MSIKNRVAKNATVGNEAILNAGCENELVIGGYKGSKLRAVLSWIIIALSGGMIFILLTWKQSLLLRARFKPCSLKEAEKILLKDENGQEFVEDIQHDKIGSKNQKIIYFENKRVKYVWNDVTSCFERLRGLEQHTCAYFPANSLGLDSETAKRNLNYYGSNAIIVEVKSFWYLLRYEAVNPFYIFQMYTVILWSVQLYYYFAVGILFLSAMSILITVVETRKQSQTLHDAVQTKSEVDVIRNNKEITISSTHLIPGDVITIPKRNYVLECDAVLVTGQCIVDESALTGESIPVTKTVISADSMELLRVDVHKHHILFGGTKVLQTRHVSEVKVKAVVLRTGFSTMKGELVRSILFPKPLDLKFYTDFLKFFVIFLILGVIAVIYSGIIWNANNATLTETVLNSLDILTFVVPPILPAAYSSIVALTQRRLKKHGIYSLSSKYINMCGGLDVVCFDKTGTLTENDLDLKAVLPIVDAEFSGVLEDPTHLPINSPLLHAMAVCHNLTIIDGQLSGYPLDIKIFESIDWHLDESGVGKVFQEECNCSPFLASPRHQLYNKENEFVILKQYPFESSAQRTTVVCRRNKDSDYHVYIKGAPEKILSLCSYDSVPDDFDDILLQHTNQGFRVIAAAWRPLSTTSWGKIEKMDRSDLEKDLEFLGIIILQNSLKPETTTILRLLNDVEIRTVMVTGDNLSTAISVAHECDMVPNNDKVIIVKAIHSSTSVGTVEVAFSYARTEYFESNIGKPNGIKLVASDFHFAIDGKSYDLLRHYNPKLLIRIIHQGTIFARMLPEQKMHLVESLQGLGHQVGMCGDGANDCGALKAAHAGIALCMAEASVAAPFTSKKPNITCVPKLIREGRASLVSCLGIFKFQVAYCFSQLFMALILFYDSVKPTDPQYIYMDMILSIIPGLTFGNVGAFKYLVKEKPVKKLLAILPLVSIFSFLLFQLLVYIIIWHYYHSQSWFIPYNFVPGQPIQPSHEGTSLFTVSSFSYLLATVVFSQGPPYRKPLYTNRLLLIFLLGAFIMCSFLTLYPGKALSHWLSLKQAPSYYFHVVLYGIALINCLFCHLWEKYVIGIIVAKKIVPSIHRYFGPFEPYEYLNKDLQSNENWPPVDQVLEIDSTLPHLPGI